MTRLLAAWVCVILFPGVLWSQPSDPAAPPAARQEAAAASEGPSYEALVGRLEAGDRTVDFTRLRLAFTETPAHSGMMMGVYQTLWRPLQAGNLPEAIAVAEKVLEANYVEINAHMVASLAYQRSDQPARAEFHRRIANGLLNSVISTGDGLTPETAYEVIDISEEYAIARSRSLSVRNVASSFPPEGSAIDSMTVFDPRTGMERVIHFNVDRARAAYDRVAPR